jgi:hypothetical protein
MRFAAFAELSMLLSIDTELQTQPGGGIQYILGRSENPCTIEKLGPWRFIHPLYQQVKKYVHLKETAACVRLLAAHSPRPSLDQLERLTDLHRRISLPKFKSTISGREQAFSPSQGHSP